jgi:hypothetical protein
LADYDRAISLAPNLAAAYFARSLLKRNLLEDVRGATSDYDQAISLQERFANDLDPNLADET